MRIKSGFMTRKIGNKIVAVAVGDRAKEFNGMIDLNETGEFIWKCLEKDSTIDEVSQRLVEEYGIDFDRAKNSATKFISVLVENELVEE